jgi:hypothetical protein
VSINGTIHVRTRTFKSNQSEVFGFRRFGFCSIILI